MADRVNGPTPLGGAYSVAEWFDVTGVETEASVAAYGEITEYDDKDQALGRTYMGNLIDAPQPGSFMSGPSVPGGEANDPLVNFHGGLTWDVWTPDGNLVYNLETLAIALQLGSVKDMREWALTAMELPVWEVMPSVLRHNLESLIGSPTPQ
jgi:hypothetical protein